MLRVDAPVGEKSPDVPPAAAPLALAEQAAPLFDIGEPERIAALKPEDSSPPEPAKPEIPVSEKSGKKPRQHRLWPMRLSRPTRPGSRQPGSRTAGERSCPCPSDRPAPASPDTDLASKTDLAPTKIATLDGPPVTIEAQPSVKAPVQNPTRALSRSACRHGGRGPAPQDGSTRGAWRDSASASSRSPTRSAPRPIQRHPTSDRSLIAAIQAGPVATGGPVGQPPFGP